MPMSFESTRKIELTLFSSLVYAYIVLKVFSLDTRFSDAYFYGKYEKYVTDILLAQVSAYVR